MAIQPTEVSRSGLWVVKVSAKNTITVTCPEGFQNLVGKEIPVEALDSAISGAIYKEKIGAKGSPVNGGSCFTCFIY
jgi:hypothetical protein